MVSFKADTKKLQQTLKLVKGAVQGKSVKAFSTTCEITVTDGKADFAVPGAIFSLNGVTKGTCKATVPFMQFMLIINDATLPETELVISENKMQIHRVIITAQTTFFKDDSILRTIQLPINYTDADLLRLPKQGYTPEELDFNKLSLEIDKAEERLNENIKAAYKHLKQYSVSFEAIEKMAREKL